MGRYTKKDAIRIVVQCAKKYKENLVNRSLLFICQDKHKNTSAIEFTFDASNFLHLTGLKLKKRKKHDGSRSDADNAQLSADTKLPESEILSEDEISALDFYNKCLDHKLSEFDFVFAEDGTTEMKLDVLPGLLTKNLTAKMIGDYQSDKPKLHTEKLAGGVTACMGFRKNTPNTRYIPDTVLKDDIKKHTSGQVRVIACYRKPRAESQYSEITYLAKNIEWENIVFPSGYEYLKELLPTPVES